MKNKDRYLIRYVTKDNLETGWQSISEEELKKLNPKIHRLERNNLPANSLKYEDLLETTTTFKQRSYNLTPVFNVRCFELIEE